MSEKPTGTSIQSPDNNVSVNFRLSRKNEELVLPVYNVSFLGHKVVNDSELEISFADSGIYSRRNLAVASVSHKEIDETYTVINGKSCNARNHCKQVIMSLRENDENPRRLDIAFRAYNDGVAFRYIFPKQKNLNDFIISSEKTTFFFAGNPTAYFQSFKEFANNHENNYHIMPLSEIDPEDHPLLDMPFRLEYPNGICVAITEANLTDYAGMYLAKLEDDSSTALRSLLSPWPGQREMKVKASTPHCSPWRVIMLGDRPGRLIESNIILNLNEPCAVEDTSWIKPGKTTWHWWNGTVAKDVDFETGLNTKTMKHYIDFCAWNNIDFHALVGHNGIGWYGGRVGEAQEREDVTTPIQEIDIEEILSHAKAKGVGIRLWVHWKPLSEKIDSAFALYEKWGIKGLMVDFMDRDDQEMVRFCHSVLKKAAKHHLKIQFHGAYKNTGIRRTYPNLVNKEGVLNLEYLKWSKRCDPEHNLIVPFTRMLAGPMDYHLGGFRSVPREEFKESFIAPTVLGTRCHHLAMYVVYENPLPMVADYPEAYRNQAGFDFIKEVPTVWDETKVINAKAGDYITVARKKGCEWYIGCMTDWTSRQLKIPLSFLSKGEYVAEIYSDASDSDEEPNRLVYSKYLVTSSDVIASTMASGGGQVVHITPIKRYISQKSFLET